MSSSYLGEQTLPFHERKVMDKRRVLAYPVLFERPSMSQSCRIAAVTRKTGLKWLDSARVEGIDYIYGISCAPHTVSNRTPYSVDSVVDGAQRYCLAF